MSLSTHKIFICLPAYIYIHTPVKSIWMKITTLLKRHNGAHLLKYSIKKETKILLSSKTPILRKHRSTKDIFIMNYT